MFILHFFLIFSLCPCELRAENLGLVNIPSRELEDMKCESDDQLFSENDYFLVSQLSDKICSMHKIPPAQNMTAKMSLLKVVLRNLEGEKVLKMEDSIEFYVIKNLNSQQFLQDIDSNESKSLPVIRKKVLDSGGEVFSLPKTLFSKKFKKGKFKKFEFFQKGSDLIFISNISSNVTSTMRENIVKLNNMIDYQISMS